jgi:hypothetical protein
MTSEDVFTGEPSKGAREAEGKGEGTRQCAVLGHLYPGRAGDSGYELVPPQVGELGFHIPKSVPVLG